MRCLLILLFSCGSMPAFAGPCTAIEKQLALVSRQLTLDQTEIAEHTLLPLAALHPDCPELLLDRGRLQAAKGDASGAADLFIRYTDLMPNDSRGLAYFGRFFLDQRDYQKADALSAASVDKNPSDPAALALDRKSVV